ncbi:hypothetical protein U1Q18_025165 [Sarracenia purpurea var. burkii]
MEAPEEFTASNDHTLMVKGKRAKRQRPFSQSSVAVTSSSSSGGGGGGGGGSGASGVGSGGGDHHLYYSLPSPSSSSDISTTCQEDEDMANCLILLAQGVGRNKPEVEEDDEEREIEKSGGRRCTETATGKPAGFFVYDCKTCNRSFPSFQALGGHRASHKKLKASVEENRVVLTAAAPRKEEVEEEEGQQTSMIGPPLSIQMAAVATAARASQINSKSSKVHECSICGSEFSSGQALGGHMRRHRAPPNPQTAGSGGRTTTEPPHEEIICVKTRNVLPLDLNLPAPPEDDHLRDAEFQFKPNKQQHQHRLVFSAPALVDCHY